MAPDPRIRNMMEQLNRMQENLRSRGIVSRLDEGEIPHAVLWPTTTSEQSIRMLGEALRAWMESHDGVSRILGLEQLLEGKSPEVASWVLGISVWGDPGSWTMHVALVVLKRGAAEEQLADSLCKLIEPGGLASVVSYEQYGYMTR